MTAHTRAAFDRVLDEHPEFRRVLTDFMMLFDAKHVLERHQPPMHETAAAYLDEVGRALMANVGLPESFVQACIDAMPPHN